MAWVTSMSVVRDQELAVRTSFLAASIAYNLVGCIACAQLVRNCCRYRPWTIQKIIHLLMFFATLVGMDWCDVLSGEINKSTCSTTERNVFYVLDQIPILAFFIIYVLLMQFWAEVYYNAVDKLPTFTDIVKPAIHWFIVIVVLVQGISWVLYASVFRNERTVRYCCSVKTVGYLSLYVCYLLDAFFTRRQAILNTALFLIIATRFIYFGRKAYTELRFVPVGPEIRSKKLKELVIMILVEKRQLHDCGTWFEVVVYYAILEIVPALSVLYFNRRLPPRRKSGGLSVTSRPIQGQGIFFSKGKGADSASDEDDPLRQSLLRG